MAVVTICNDFGAPKNKVCSEPPIPRIVFSVCIQIWGLVLLFLSCLRFPFPLLSCSVLPSPSPCFYLSLIRMACTLVIHKLTLTFLLFLKIRRSKFPHTRTPIRRICCWRGITVIKKEMTGVRGPERLLLLMYFILFHIFILCVFSSVFLAFYFLLHILLLFFQILSCVFFFFFLTKILS